MKRRTGSVRLWAAAFWLLVWEGASLALAATTGGRMLLLASPVQALGRLLALAGTAAFWQAVAFSSLRILGGFLLACALAAVLAPLAARFQWIRDLLSPLVAVVKAVPVVSFIILALIFFSSENLSLLISALMVFPPVYLNVLEGIGHTDRQLLEMARVLPAAAGHLPAGGAALFPLRRVIGAGPVLEVRRGGGGHRPACRVYRRGAVHRQGVLPDRRPLRLDGGDRDGIGDIRAAVPPPGGRRSEKGGQLMEIAVKHLCKSFGGRTVLRDLTFTAGPGITAVMAPSGTGKTTLLRILLGLERPDSGTVEGLAGKRLTAVFQEDRLLEHLSAEGNLRFVLGRVYDPAAARALLDRLGLPDTGAQPVREFSGGMKQRIVIAIALACEPKLILADEPTTALDVTIQAQMLGLINELQKRLNTAMILITHDLGVVAQTCEKVMVMYAGEAIEYGTAEDIFETTQRHPYTQGLFNAIPKLDENTKRLEAIEGMMADPTQKIEGCRFADRCKYATAACKKAQKMREVTPGHFIRCCRFDPPQSNT